MKKILHFIRNHRLMFTLVTAGVISFFIVMIAVLPKQTVAPVVPSLQEQTDTIVYEGVIEEAPTVANTTNNVSNIDTTAKTVVNTAEVKEVSSSDFSKKIETNSENIVASSVNPTRHLIAFAVDGAKEDIIYVTSYLDIQLDGFYEQLTEAGSDVNAVYSGTSTIAKTTNTRNIGMPIGGATASSTQQTSSAPTLNDVFTFLLISILIWIIVSYFVRRFKAKKEIALRTQAEAKADVPTTRFSDVAGADEAVEEMQELVSFLRNPEQYEALGAKSPKGALLVGPPGTGKTMLARAVAGEAGVPFYNVAGSDFVEMYVGVGAKRVRELFDKARKHPEGAIVFIDEIDAVGRSRSSNTAGNSNVEQENTLNALLVELDGFKQSKVVILGATNRDDLLDKALLRPGRLEKKVHVPLPDRLGREKILTVHAEGKPLNKTVSLSLVARRTPGLSGAELAQIVNEAAMTAGRDSRQEITDKDFDEAIAIVTMGKGRKSAVVSDEDKMLTAWHEAGHAICGLVQVDAVSPVAISILPRSFAGGVTHFPARDSGYMTRKQAYSQLVTAMGGMAAEQLHIGEGEFTTGPSSDLEQGSKLAFAMVTQYGMGESLFVKNEGILRASETATDEALEEAEALLRKALEDAKIILSSHAKLVDAFVEALLERETLSQLEIDELMAGHKLKPLTSAPPAPRQVYDSGEPRKSIYKDVKFDIPEAKKTGVLANVVNVFKPKKKKYKI